MNVYDFDNTILRGDSTARFTGYCFLRYPAIWLDLPGQAANAVLFALRLRKKQAFKQRLLSYLSRIGDVDAAVEAFWRKNFRRVKPFYAQTHRADDVVISASPEFLIRPACERLGIAYVIGSPVEKTTGKFFGPNCHGAEKVRRWREAFGDVSPSCFFSDSLSDLPMADIAERAVLVRNRRSAHRFRVRLPAEHAVNFRHQLGIDVVKAQVEQSRIDPAHPIIGNLSHTTHDKIFYILQGTLPDLAVALPINRGSSGINCK